MKYEHITAEGTLRIKKENFNKLRLKVIKESKDWAEIYPEDTEQMERMKDIHELFNMFYFQPWSNTQGDIQRVCFIGETLDNCFEFMNCIAPFVEEGCYIDFRADMDIWRWVFTQGKCKEIFPELVFELKQEQETEEENKIPTCCHCHNELEGEYNYIEIWGQELPICHYCEREYYEYYDKQLKQWCIDECDKHYKKILGLIEDLQTGEISASQMWQLMFNKGKADLMQATELVREEWKQDYIKDNIIE